MSTSDSEVYISDSENESTSKEHETRRINVSGEDINENGVQAEVLSKSDAGSVEGHSRRGSLESDDGLSFESFDDFERWAIRRIKEVCNGERRNCILHSAIFRNDKGTPEEIETGIQDFIRRGKNCELKWLIRHANHYHVIHDCKWTNGQCRCFGQLFHKLSSKRGPTNITFGQIKEKDAKNLIEYHFQAGRQFHYLQFGDCGGSTLLDRLESIQFNEYPELEREDRGHFGMVAQCGIQSKIFWGTSEQQTSVQYNSEHDSSDEGLHGQKKRRKFDHRRAQDQEAEEISKFMISICASPITDADRTTPWIDSKYRFINDIEYSVKKAKNFLHMKFSKMSLKEFKNFYQERLDNDQPCLWSAPNINEFDNMYFDLDTSVYKALQLLIFQYHGSTANYEIPDNDLWKNTVFTYIKELILFLDKKSGKNNCQYYISPSCSGKTFFFDMIKDYLLLHGNMSNWNRNSQFPLQMCVDKKIIFWNEPNCEEAALEDLKKVLGGEYYAANIKNRMHTEIRRTPVIITANHRIFPNKPEWECRISYHTWDHAPFLLDNGSKRLHPMAFSKLINLCENYFEEELI